MSRVIQAIPAAFGKFTFPTSSSTATFSLPLEYKPTLPIGQNVVPAIAINRLETLELRSPLTVLVEKDEDAYLAVCPDIPQLYGHGEDSQSAVLSLQKEIESLWNDLKEDDDFSDEFLGLKRFLARIVNS